MSNLYKSTKYFYESARAGLPGQSSAFIWNDCPLARWMKKEGWAMILDERTYENTAFENFDIITILAELDWNGASLCSFKGMQKLTELSLCCLDCPKDMRIASHFDRQFFIKNFPNMHQIMKVASRLIPLPGKIVQFHDYRRCKPANYSYYLRIMLYILRHGKSHPKSVTDKLVYVSQELNKLQTGQQADILAAWQLLVQSDLERILKCLSGLSSHVSNGAYGSRLQNKFSFMDWHDRLKDDCNFLESQFTALNFSGLQIGGKERVLYLKTKVEELRVSLHQLDKKLPSCS